MTRWDKTTDKDRAEKGGCGGETAGEVAEGGRDLKPSAIAVYQYLRRGWRKNREIFNACPTDTPTKRVSELWKAGLIVKRRSPDDPRYVEYRAKTMPEILMGGTP